MSDTDGKGLDAPLGQAGERETSTPSITVSKTREELRAEALEGEKLGARKLTFTEQCGAFAALYDGVRNQTVARAFGVSLQCASKISGCLEQDPDPHRLDEHGQRVFMDHNRNRRSLQRHTYYEAVAREFEALGVEEFNRRYLTERVLNRIILAKVQLRDEKAKTHLERREATDIRRSREATDERKERRPYDPERDQK